MWDFLGKIFGTKMSTSDRILDPFMVAYSMKWRIYNLWIARIVYGFNKIWFARNRHLHVRFLFLFQKLLNLFLVQLNLKFEANR